MSKINYFAESLKCKYLNEAIAISGKYTSWKNYKGKNSNKAVCIALELLGSIFPKKFSSTVIVDKAHY